jgi:hypothetical protein
LFPVSGLHPSDTLTHMAIGYQLSAIFKPLLPVLPLAFDHCQSGHHGLSTLKSDLRATGLQMVPQRFQWNGNAANFAWILALESQLHGVAVTALVVNPLHFQVVAGRVAD